MKIYSILVFLILIPFSSAFAITPAQHIFGYDPGSEQTSYFEIINSENKKVDLVLAPQGDLKDFVSLSNYTISLTPEVKNVRIYYSLETPAKLSPGSHNIDILITEVPNNFESGKTYINSIVGVITKAVIDVPYPGKYVESALSISVSNDSLASFVIPVVSKGNLNIAHTKAFLDIFNSSNSKIASLVTEEVPLSKGERKELAAQWAPANNVPGIYRVFATIVYDEATIDLRKEFSIGSDTLELKNVEVNDFSLGQIAKFEFLVNNNLGTPISDAYILMQVFDKSGDVMAEFKSATYDFAPFGSQLLVAFWDTEGVSAGSYDAKAFIHFGEKSIQKQLTLDVSENDISVVGVGYVVKSSKSGGSFNTILVIAIAVLVLLNFTWFLLLRKKVRHR
jgi:hypothetical protein